jgi:phosphonoacetaldehyde hydrolase
MVETLRARGVRLGSSTGYTRTLMDVVEPLAAAQGYAAEVVITADDVPLGRPAPWANLRACEHLGVTDFSRVVVVDDTTVGVEAGRAAGMWTVGVTRTGNEVGLSAADWEALPNPQQTCLLNAARNRLLRAGAHFVLESAAELSELIEVIESRLARGDRP